MAITKEELNLIEIFKDLGNICKTEATCGQCAEKHCLVGYSKICTAQCRIKEKTYVENGFADIPPSDIRGGYDEFAVLHAIAHLLLQCRCCKCDHFDNCIINLVRSCMEIIEFGEEQTYDGDPLSYMIKIAGIDPDKAAIIRDEYVAAKERKYMEQEENK